MNEFGDRCEECAADSQRIDTAKASMVDENRIGKLAEVFKALSDPTRLKLIHALSRSELCVCDIAEILGMTQSAISHQLRFLRTLRLVKFRKEGKSAIYSLDDEHILQLFNQGMEHVLHS